MTSLAHTAVHVLEWDSDPPLTVEMHRIVDDGVIPNNSALPLLLYRNAVSAEQGKREALFRDLFQWHGWAGLWVNGVYGYHHYHSTAHEVLGFAEGTAKLQLGGPRGLVADLEAGDAVVIPAGISHCLLAGEGLVVVGAYPQGQNWDLCLATPEDRAKALENIPWVPLPETDPILGAFGPLPACWRD